MAGIQQSLIPLLACFYCGADSTEILMVLIGIIGSLGLATLFIGLGLTMRGRFKDSEALAGEVFKAEERE